VMATTLEEELSPPCLDDVADNFSLAEEEAEFQELEQEVPKTSPVELHLWQNIRGLLGKPR
jgi:hypothetical protein